MTQLSRVKGDLVFLFDKLLDLGARNARAGILRISSDALLDHIYPRWVSGRRPGLLRP